MGKVLTAAQIEGYRRQGYVSGVRVLAADEARGFLEAFHGYERERWGQAGRAYDDADGREWLRKPHRFAHWAYALATDPRIVDVIEDLLGPDILLWDTKLFPKPARSRSYVSWHQDGTYLGLEPQSECVTAWIALSDSLPENGAMRVVPGSHRQGQQVHTPTHADGNLLLNGQVIEGVAADSAVDLPLRAGELSVHDMMLVHGSLPNTSDRPRIGMSINYVTPRVRETVMTRPVTLLRGEDRHHHFETLESRFAAR